MTATTDRVLELEPMPSPRPRVSKWGAYMPAKYTAHKKELARLLGTLPRKLTGELLLSLLLVCKPMKASKFSTPMGDVDNFAKTLMDTMQDAGWYDDDRQVIRLSVEKRFADKGETPHYRFTLKEFQ